MVPRTRRPRRRLRFALSSCHGDQRIADARCSPAVGELNVASRG
ncbi:hypothetical protein I552_0375 [Mycobacterium xenopi 3993]|nr:hypothetical protein I552_0375 [Mycobacterium xenopi 3993]